MNLLCPYCDGELNNYKENTRSNWYCSKCRICWNSVDNHLVIWDSLLQHQIIPRGILLVMYEEAV